MVVWHIQIFPHRQAGSSIIFCSAASFPLRGCRVPSKVLFTAKHLPVFGLFRIALSKRRGEKKRKGKRKKIYYSSGSNPHSKISTKASCASRLPSPSTACKCSFSVSSNSRPLPVLLWAIARYVSSGVISPYASQWHTASLLVQCAASTSVPRT